MVWAEVVEANVEVEADAVIEVNHDYCHRSIFVRSKSISFFFTCDEIYKENSKESLLSIGYIKMRGKSY